jgi:VanZ family protein
LFGRIPNTIYRTVQSRAGWGIAFLIAIVIIIISLIPFPWSRAGISQASRPLATGYENGWDMLENVLFYIPLGLALAPWLMSGVGLCRFPAVAITAGASLSLTLILETLQWFLPSRQSSLEDVVCNVLGSLVGFACVDVWNKREMKGFLAGYVLLAFLVSIPLQRRTALRNWDENFALILGNELTGDRPWRGTIGELSAVDQAIPDRELKEWLHRLRYSLPINDPISASYVLTENHCCKDRADNLPDLIWRTPQGKSMSSSHQLLGPDNWLQSETAVAYLNRRIAQKSKFTIGVSFASASADQEGPARIISISKDPGQRNFTMGQQGSSLVFRLRTPLTGENGVNPQLSVPNVFATKRSHVVIAAYDGSTLTVYLDHPEQKYKLALNLGAAFVSYFGRPVADFMVFYRFVYYIAIFFPVGILLSRVLKKRKFSSTLHLGLKFLGPLAASAALEGMLVAASGKPVEWSNLIISISAAGVGFLLTRVKVLPFPLGLLVRSGLSATFHCL